MKKISYLFLITMLMQQVFIFGSCKSGIWGTNTYPNGIYFYDKYGKFGQYYAFTNFYANPVTIDGKIWPTSEHYFQAMKFTDPALQEQVRNLPYPRDAFNFSRTHWADVRPDWYTYKMGVMRKAVLAKFSEEPLKSLLLNTGDRPLIEDAGKNDDFWGAGADCNGENWLGRILMETRKKLGGK